jgi:hypothetical protein
MADSLVAYKPINDISFIPLVEKELSQIPPYEDSGIIYQGKYKSQKTEKDYELRPQTPKYYVIDNVDAGNSYINLNNAPSKFFCKQIIYTISIDKAPATPDLEDFIIYDDYQIAAGVRPVFQHFRTSNLTVEPQTVVINLESPFVITSGVIGYDFGSKTIGSHVYIGVTLIGWEEN